MITTQTVSPADAGQILTDETAAALLTVEPRTIRSWRTRRGLPFVRLTAKVVRIRRADLDKWLARHAVAITRGQA
jgi:excisionase family DNA binding protein